MFVVSLDVGSCVGFSIVKILVYFGSGWEVEGLVVIVKKSVWLCWCKLWWSM